ncbi:AgmX/PglI C-terminal domain-containing protein, partial [Myxococcota bacterium]|nr:AgmX/PglI C-terminal domain-containing protein [Myxococcota bacterium]
RPPAAATAAPRPAPTAAPPPDAGGLKTLSRNEIMGVVSANTAAIQACGAAQPDLKGILAVATTIERDGSVSAAAVTTSKFRGTPVGTCVEQKVRGLRFPKFSGDPVRFNLPLTL